MKRAILMLILLASWTAMTQELRYGADYAGFRSFFPDLIHLSQTPASNTKPRISLLPTATAYRQVADNQIDFAAVGREPLDGDAYEAIAISLPVAWDAIAIIAHPDNPTANLSLQQLRDIYTGKITNWKALGGADRPIRSVYIQDTADSAQYLMSRFLFGKPIHAMHGEAVSTAQMAESIVESNPDALAFTFYSSARERTVKLLPINEITPSYPSILIGQYPFFTEVYLLARPGVDRTRAGRDLVKKAGSAGFRRILRRIGIVPYTSAPDLIAHKSTRDAFLARDLGY